MGRSQIYTNNRSNGCRTASADRISNSWRLSSVSVEHIIQLMCTIFRSKALWGAVFAPSLHSRKARVRIGRKRRRLTMTNNNSGSLSRGSMYQASSNGSNTTSSVGCNRCSKKLTTTLFVCACDCVFCEGTLLLVSVRCGLVSIVCLVGSFAAEQV